MSEQNLLNLNGDHKPFNQFNGVHSSQSSRSSSPSIARPIPSSQLPPSVNRLGSQMGNLKIDNSSSAPVNMVTPSLVQTKITAVAQNNGPIRPFAIKGQQGVAVKPQPSNTLTNQQFSQTSQLNRPMNQPVLNQQSGSHLTQETAAQLGSAQQIGSQLNQQVIQASHQQTRSQLSQQNPQIGSQLNQQPRNQTGPQQTGSQHLGQQTLSFQQQSGQLSQQQTPQNQTSQLGGSQLNPPQFNQQTGLKLSQQQGSHLGQMAGPQLSYQPGPQQGIQLNQQQGSPLNQQQKQPWVQQQGDLSNQRGPQLNQPQFNQQQGPQLNQRQGYPLSKPPVTQPYLNQQSGPPLNQVSNPQQPGGGQLNQQRPQLNQQTNSQLGFPQVTQPPGFGQQHVTMPQQHPMIQPFSKPQLTQPPLNSIPQSLTSQQYMSQHPLPPPPGLNQTQPTFNSPRPNLLSNRYPSTPVAVLPPQQQQQQQQQQQYASAYQQNPQAGYPSVTQTGFNRLWGIENFDLLQTPNVLPPIGVEAPKIRLGQEALDQANCSPDIFRCTVTKIPENQSLLQKSRLPLGLLIHPFKDLSHLPVIQCNVIVRCRSCRTYINPFITFVDTKRWKCNLCYRVNELPEEFQYDPVTKTYGDPSRRPEIKSSTLEYIAPAEYMLRPPQPAVYLFLLDVSRLAVESGYLQIVTTILLDELKNLPGDARTQIGFIAFNSSVHFYALPEDVTQPQEMTVLDIDDIFLPTPDNLLVNLKDRYELVVDLLNQLPNRYSESYDTNSALGPALQAAFKLMGATGGRVSVFQASLPNVGPGALTVREDPSKRTNVEVAQLNPVTDFYKRLALECSGQQVAVDLFVVNSQYVDLATVSGISRFSGGCLHHFPLLRPNNRLTCERFARSFRRYLTRKIGFEAVMRIRCTRGLSIHTFHGNFFVRSTDLLSLPNINPDAGFGMQVSIEESLSDVQSVCFQAALLYTSSKGERRIRVHTLCIPIASTLHEIIHSADQQCIIGLLSKMAVDRSMQASLSDAREAFINVAIDVLSSYKLSLNSSGPTSGLMAPTCLRLLPLYISALLKHTAFRTGVNTRLDDRVTAMIDMKTQPLYLLIQQIYPDLYSVHDLENQQVVLNSEEEPVPVPPRLQLTARCIDNKGAFLMDTGDHMVLFVCQNVPQEFLTSLGVPSYQAIPEDMYEIPMLENNAANQRLHRFINYLNEDKPYTATLHVMRDDSAQRISFFGKLIEDRVENALSYHEFLQHLKTQVK